MFVSDNPQHNGIQREEPSDMFIADTMPGDAQDHQPVYQQQQAVAPRGPPQRMPHQQPKPRVAVPPRRQPQVPNAGLFGNNSRQDLAPANANLFNSNQEVVEQDYGSEGHQTVEFEEDSGFHQDNNSHGFTDDPSSQFSGSGQRDRVVLNQPFQTGGGGASPHGETSGSKGSGPIDYDNEPPILEELGIKPEEIVKKFLAIITQRGFKEVSTYEDMAGAIFVLFLFGSLLLLVSRFKVRPLPQIT